MVTVTPSSEEPPEVPADVATIIKGAAAPRVAPIPDTMVVLPAHYARWKIEPVYFIGENSLDFLTGNIIKYVMRAPFKHTDGGRQDSLKFIRYSFMRAKQLLGDPDWAKPYHVPNLEQLIEQELSYHAPRD
jgi:hypothetical protein